MAERDDSVVRVTLRDVYDVVTKVAETQEEMKQAAALDRQLAEAEVKRVDDHESRIRSLEFRVWSLPSVATILSLGSLVIGLVKIN